MKLLFVCNEYPPARHGGIGVFVRTLGQQLGQLGHGVTVVGLDPNVKTSTWSRDGHVDVLRLASPYRQLREIRIGKYGFVPALIAERMYLSKQVRKVARERRVDVVESYDWSGPLWSAPGRPLVVRLHGANTAHSYYENKRQSRLLRYLERRNVLFADALVAVSRHIGNLTLEALSLDSESFDVIYNSVDTCLFQPLAIERDSNRVLYVGSIHRRKGLEELMSAWRHVIGTIPEARLALVGNMPAQEYVDELRSMLPVGLHDTVTFVDYVPHHTLPTWYNGAAVAVFPSRAEAFGLTCAEAMACGTAVVMTSRASGPELVEHEVSGLLADPANDVELSDAIIRLLQDEQLKLRVGRTALERVHAKFDLDTIVKQNVRFYEEVMEKHATS